MNGMSSSTGQAAQDPERRVIRIGGAEAADFLQSILTSDMEALSPGETRASALLTPQGKILFDFLVFAEGDAYLLDTHVSGAADLAKRLGFYKLRAKVEIVDVSDDYQVLAAWGRRLALGYPRHRGPRSAACRLRNAHPGKSRRRSAGRLRAGRRRRLPCAPGRPCPARGPA